MFHNCRFSLKTAKRAISRLFVPAIAIMALMPACSMDEPLEVPASQEASRDIGFRAVGSKVLNTRAAQLLQDDVTNFKVVAINTGTNGALLTNEVVTRSGTTGSYTWDYAQHAKWPAIGSFVSFFAVSTNDGASSPALTQTTGAAAATLSYEVPTTAADQRDLLVAVNENVATPTTLPYLVSLNFQHALSRVMVKMRNTGATNDVLVEEVKLVNFAKQGTLAMTTANFGSGWASGPVWTSDNTVAANLETYEATLLTDVSTTDRGSSASYVTLVGPGYDPSASTADNSFMVIPQKVIKGTSITDPLNPATTITESYLYIKAKTVKESDHTATVVDSKEFYVALLNSGQTDGFTFEPGKEYTINIDISSQANFDDNFIVFGNITVATWDNNQGAGYNQTGPLGPDRVAVGEILAADPINPRWDKAVVASVDAAGRPKTVLALVGYNTGDWNGFHSTNYTAATYMNDQIAALTTLCGLHATWASTNTAATWATLDSRVLAAAVSLFGLVPADNSQGGYKSHIVSETKSNQPRIKALNTDGTILERNTYMSSYSPAAVIALINY